MKKLFIIFLILISNLTSIANEKVNIVVPDTVLKNYKLFVNNRNPLLIKNFSGEYSSRDIGEMIILLRALKLGGYKKDINFITSATNKNDIELVTTGIIAGRGNTSWMTDFNKNRNYLYISIPVVDIGEFEAGFYTSSKNSDILKTKNLSELKKLKMVSSKFWTIDWITLEKIFNENLYHTPKWNNMVKDVIDKKVDLFLAPFQPSDDMSFIKFDTKFVPIPNLKVGLQGTRHFIVSRKHPEGKQLYKALNIGLKIMKEKAIIKKIYIETGFYNQKVKNWTKVN